MKRFALATAVLLAGAACLPGGAQAAFGLDEFDVTFANSDGTPAIQAGSHPFAATTSFRADLDSEGAPEGVLRSLLLGQAPGLVGDTTAYPRCTNADFLAVDEGASPCPLDTVVGIAAVSAADPGVWRTAPIFNLSPPSGVLTRLGFTVFEASIVIDIGLGPDPPYRVTAASQDIPQALEILAAKIQLWGDPSNVAHDGLRGNCGIGGVTLLPGEEFEFESPGGESCPVGPRSRPFLTLPTSCAQPQISIYSAFSWEGGSDFGSVVSHDNAGDPQPFTGCGHLGFGPAIAAKPTTDAARSPTGLDLSFDVHDDGLTSIAGISQSAIREVVVALPVGMTLSSLALKGIGVCSEVDLAEETLQAAPGEGCPEASRIGTVEVESPLVDEPLEGSLFAAEQFNAVPAFYIVVKSPELGIVVKQLAEIESDPETGQLIVFAEDIPQTAVLSHFELHLQRGNGPLVSPPTCGAYQVWAEAIPWSDSAPVVSASSFQIVTGPGAGPCPPAFGSGSEPKPGPTNAAGLAAGPVAGNVRPAKHRCAKGKHKVRRNGKTRCVRKRQAKHKERHRRPI